MNVDIGLKYRRIVFGTAQLLVTFLNSARVTECSEAPYFDPVEARRFFDFAAAAYT